MKAGGTISCIRFNSTCRSKPVTSPRLFLLLTRPLNNQPIDAIDIDPGILSVNYWVSALDCSELELRVAVAEVGPSAKDVSNELGKVL
jgi:hypothetical protein